QGQPGPNGNNNHGLCTAYFNGQKSGWSNKSDGAPPPFSNLQSTAESHENSGDNESTGDPSSSQQEAASDVYSLCNDSSFNSKGIGGNPCHGRDPGLFDSCSS